MTVRRKDPNQFKLFMTGTEWEAQITRSTDGPLDSVWPQKIDEANTPGTHHGAGMTQTIASEGYRHERDDPPTILIEDTNLSGTKQAMVQSEGHHRVAAAAEHERNTGEPVYIPTNYVDNSMAGRRARQGRRQ